MFVTITSLLLFKKDNFNYGYYYNFIVEDNITIDDLQVKILQPILYFDRYIKSNKLQSHRNLN